ncbi:hypothetical protein [Rhizobium leguminosarum]
MELETEGLERSSGLTGGMKVLRGTMDEVNSVQARVCHATRVGMIEALEG